MRVERIKNPPRRYGYFRSNKHSADIRRRDTRCFRIGTKYRGRRVAGGREEEPGEGLDFAKTRG